MNNVTLIVGVVILIVGLIMFFVGWYRAYGWNNSECGSSSDNHNHSGDCSDECDNKSDCSSSNKCGKWKKVFWWGLALSVIGIVVVAMGARKKKMAEAMSAVTPTL